MPVQTVKTPDSFIKEMKFLTQEMEIQYELLITGKGKIFLVPLRSTRRWKTLILADFNEEDIKRIKKVAKECKVRPSGETEDYDPY